MIEIEEMFSEQALNEGWVTAQVRCGPFVTRKDVEAIVSTVVSNGLEELYVDHAISDDLLAAARTDALESLRQHMRNQLAIDALRNDCVMLALPRETSRRGEWGTTMLRLIVPVRRLTSADTSPLGSAAP